MGNGSRICGRKKWVAVPVFHTVERPLHTSHIVLDFNGDFNLTDMAGISNDARTKSLAKISKDKDSLVHVYDSVGKAYYKDAQTIYYPSPKLQPAQLAEAKKIANSKEFQY